MAIEIDLPEGFSIVQSDEGGIDLPPGFSIAGQEEHPLSDEKGRDVSFMKNVAKASTAKQVEPKRKLRNGKVELDLDLPEGFTLPKAVGVGLAKGTIGLAESVGSMAEWAGHRLDNRNESWGKDLARLGKEASQFWGEAGKRFEPPAEYRKSILDNPELLVDQSWWAYSIAETVPSFAASILPGMAGAKAIKVGGAILKFDPNKIKRLAKLGGALIGGLSGGALEGSSTYKQALEKGWAEPEAASAAELMTLAAAGLNAISVNKFLSSGGLRGRVVSGVTEAVTEWLEEPSEAAILDEDIIQAMRDGVNVMPASFILGLIGGGGGDINRKLKLAGDVVKKLDEQKSLSAGKETKALSAGKETKSLPPGNAPKALGPGQVMGPESDWVIEDKPKTILRKPIETEFIKKKDYAEDSSKGIPDLTTSNEFSEDTGAGILIGDDLDKIKMALDKDPTLWTAEERVAINKIDEFFADKPKVKLFDYLGRLLRDETGAIGRNIRKYAWHHGSVQPVNVDSYSLFDKEYSQFDTLLGMHFAKSKKVANYFADRGGYVYTFDEREVFGKNKIKILDVEQSSGDDQTDILVMGMKALKLTNNELVKDAPDINNTMGLTDWFDLLSRSEQVKIIEAYKKILLDQGYDALRYFNDDTEETYGVNDVTALIILDPKKVFNKITVTRTRGKQESFLKSILKDETGAVGKDIRNGNAPIFYSKLEREVQAKMPKSMPLKDFVNFIKSRGIKADELEWSGAEDFVRLAKNPGPGEPVTVEGKTVTKEDFLRFITENKVEIKEIQKPGGESDNLTQNNPRDILYERILDDLHRPDVVGAYAHENTLSMFLSPPSVEQIMEEGIDDNYEFIADELYDYLHQASDEELEIIADSYGIVIGYTTNNPQYEKYVMEGPKEDYKELLITLPNHPGKYQSGHWSEQNVLAHVRFDTRTDADGKKVLFIEEIQSDWHQDGKKKGYRDNIKSYEGKVEKSGEYFIVRWPNGEFSGGFTSEEAAYNFATDRLQQERRYSSIPPRAPWSKNWHELTLKRMLRYAAENGFDKIAWTTGEMQQKRYDLSKQIDRLDVGGGNNNWFFVGNKDGRPVITKNNIPDSELESYIGRELAEKARAGFKTDEIQKFSGLDLKIGGKWAENLYDVMIPNFLSKHTKKWGAEVKNTEINIGEKEQLPWKVYMMNTPTDFILEDAFDTKEVAKEYVNSLPKADRKLYKIVHEPITTEITKVKSIDVTIALRDSVLTEGQELYAGLPLNKIWQYLPASFRAKWGEFWAPFSSAPATKEILAARYKQFGDIDRAERTIKHIHKEVSKFDMDTRKTIFRVLDGQVPINTLPKEAQVVTRTLQKLTDQVGKALVSRKIISQQAYDEHKGKYVHYMYLRHVLGDDRSSGNFITPTGKLNLSYTKQRKDLTTEERLELGLIEDASIAVPTGLGKALIDITKYDYLAKLAANPEWTWQPSIVDVGGVKMGIGKLAKEVEAYKKMVDAHPNNPDILKRYNLLNSAYIQAQQQSGNPPEGFTMLPETKTYGPLAGAYVRTPIAQDIMPLVSSTIGRAHKNVIGKGWSKLLAIENEGVALFKMAHVALNIPTAVRNIVSNFIQINISGRALYHIPGDVVKGIKSVQANDQYAREARAYGLFRTNWAVTEINEVLAEFSKVDASNWDTFLGAIKNLAKYYGGIDDFAKMAIYRQQREAGKSVEDAVLHAHKWGMDYSLASRSVKEARRHLVPFFSYQYKIAPLLWEAFNERPLTVLKWAVIPHAFAQAATAALDLDDDDWEELKRSLPSYVSNSWTYAIMPWKDEKGRSQWVNLEYYFPWSNWLSIFKNTNNLLVSGGEPEYLREIRKDLGFSNPFLELFEAWGSNKDPYTGQPIINSLDPPHRKVLSAMEFVWNKWAPGMLTRKGALGYTIDAVQGEPDRWGKTVSPGQAIGRWFGINIVTISPQQTQALKQFKIQEKQQELTRVLRDPQVSQERKRELTKKFNEDTSRILRGE